MERCQGEGLGDCDYKMEQCQGEGLGNCVTIRWSGVRVKDLVTV